LEMPASNDFQQSTESPAAIPQQPAENEN